ncbi:MAG TPA: folate-binding protein [Jatrophihabitantaceae bacterium]|nr:folate-binding protein [Jatrophihabitantaceae bacterium]
MTTDLGQAVFTDGVDADVPWHYGDPLREQRILATAAGVVDRSNRPVLTVSGDDRLSWLHTICSQHVSELSEGDVTESLVLSPHGHVEQQWAVTELGGVVWIDTEPGAAPVVLDYLHKMQFLRRVESADASPEWALLSVVGPAADEVLARAGLATPAAGHAEQLKSGGFVRRLPDPAIAAADLVVPRGDLAATMDLLRRSGATPAGMWAYDALRVQARLPRLGFETDHRTIPHEVGWIGSAVHLNKGCYRGQETVARVQNLGRPPRRLVLLHLSGDSDVLPPQGTPVELAGRAIGFIGTAVHHHELGPIALAVLKRSTADDAALSVAGVPAAIDPDIV